MYIIDPCVWVNCWMQLPDSYKVARPGLCPQCCITEEMWLVTSSLSRGPVSTGDWRWDGGGGWGVSPHQHQPGHQQPRVLLLHASKQQHQQSHRRHVYSSAILECSHVCRCNLWTQTQICSRCQSCLWDELSSLVVERYLSSINSAWFSAPLGIAHMTHKSRPFYNPKGICQLYAKYIVVYNSKKIIQRWFYNLNFVFRL